ncbi:MAG: choice-of-anchor J domain-containing protein, partial [Muribaculaceae bacterium]|nr:choice-of-anchor J domain-containing protein [Muribaculaceae bacterium]
PRLDQIQQLAGHTLPTDNTRHNLLWRVTDNDSKNVALVIGYSAYEGNCFAHIISDVAYVTDEGYHEPDFQDEWLVTPTITPQTEDWLYFKLNYSPAWAVYSNTVGDFSARNNDLEVYVTTDDGQTWVKLWNLIDDEVKPNYTEEELRADLINLYRNYVPIYINLKDYVGSNVKLAFRFFGRMGQGMALDNVAVGVPMPVANYTLPGGVFMQQISCNNDFPATPTLLAPYGEEITWRNTSTDILRSEWTYEDETGAKVTSPVKNLVTPAYGFNTTHMTPELMGFFESRESDPYHTNFPQMQAGGFISGYDQSGWNGEFAVGSTDVFDGDIRSFSEYISLNPEIDLAWEKIQGYLDGALDVYGYCSVYAKPTVAYGFDYIDIMARVLEAVPDNDGIEVMVFALDEQTANPTNKIGHTVLWGKDIPADRPDEYINLRFKFDVPVYVEKDIMILFMGCRSGGNVSFPCMLTTHPEKYGNNLVYWIHYDSEVEGGYYDEFKNLGTFPVSGGRHFAGFLMGMGATYSTMERLD